MKPMTLAFFIGLVIGLLLSAGSPPIYGLLGDHYFGERMTDYYGNWRWTGDGWNEEWVFIAVYFTESAKQKRDTEGKRFLPSCRP